MKAPRFRWVLGLLPLLVLTALLLPPSPAPEQVAWKVIGDALIARCRVPDGLEVHLEADGEEYRPEPSETNWRRFVLRGLSREQPVRARLRWPGGASPWSDFRPDALAVSPELRLASEGRVEIEVLRDCTVAWMGQEEEGLRLPPGRYSIPAPSLEEENLTLVFEEEEVRFERSWSTRRLLDLEARRLLPGFQQVAASPLLEVGAPPGSRTPGRVVTFGGSSGRLLEWLPRLLEAPLDREVKRQMWSTLEDLQRSQAVWNQGGASLHLVDPVSGQPGHRSWQIPTWDDEDHARVEPSLGPGSPPQTRSPEKGYEITDAPPVPLLGGPIQRAARRLLFDWPREVPARARRLALSLHAHWFPEGAQFRVQAKGAEEPFLLHLWHPRPAGGRKYRYDGWIGVVVPADLAPLPGTPMEITLKPMIGSGYIGWLEEVRVSWPAGS